MTRMFSARILSFFAVLLMLPAIALATPEGAAELANSIGTRALETLKSGQSDAQKQQQLESMFLDIVDTKWIGQFVVGRSWRSMTPEQQQSYLAAYSNFLVKYYVSNFKEYATGVSFKVTGARAINDTTSLVGVDINRQHADPIHVDYRVREANSTYKITDIVVEGVSLLTTQRSEFSAVIERKGIDHLISQLQTRAAQPAPPTSR